MEELKQEIEDGVQRAEVKVSDITHRNLVEYVEKVLDDEHMDCGIFIDDRHNYIRY